MSAYNAANATADQSLFFHSLYTTLKGTLASKICSSLQTAVTRNWHKCESMLTDRGNSLVVLAPLDRAASFLVVSSLLIAIVGVMITILSFLLYAIPIDIRLLLASFLVVFSVYNLNKLTDIREDAINLPYRTSFIAQHQRTITVAVVGAFSSALLLALSHSVYAMLVISSPVVIGFLYSAGIAGFRLKRIKALKSVIVALSWTFVATVLPLTVMTRGVVEILLVFWFFFVKTFVNVTLFDVRDVEGDIVQGTMTIPACLGRNKTRSLLLTANSSLVLWLGYSYLTGFFHTYALLLVMFVAYGYWYILRFCGERSIAERSLDLLVDGEWLFVAAAAVFFVWT